MSNSPGAADDALRNSFRIDFDSEGPFVGAGSPAPDGMTYVGWDQQQLLPAYRVQSKAEDVLVGFSPTLQFPPSGYGGDYYVDEFTDARLRESWLNAKADPSLHAQVQDQFAILQVPHQFRLTGSVDRRGQIDPHGDVDLQHIRRPEFFGAEPWREPIAAIDDRTTVVEITVPREAHERLHLGLTDPIKLRGWFIRGDGISDDRGGREHPLMVMISGRTVETTAITHPDDPTRVYDADTARWIPRSYPSEDGRTEVWAARPWRQYLLEMVRAGFDVLTLDKRGHGVSGGANDSNMGEQANDIFRALDQLESGEGLRLLLADGTELSDTSAGGVLLRGRTARSLPVIICGPSQGAMVSAWAMHKNFVEDRAYDVDGRAEPPRGYNLRGAILLAPFSAGLGYRSRLSSITEGANRVELNIQAFPSSEVLANVHRWPAVFVGRGLWDFAESLEGSLDFYRRARGLKEIAVVRGPHSECEWTPANVAFMVRRMTAFATAAVLGHGESPGAADPETLRDLVATSPRDWDETSDPQR